MEKETMVLDSSWIHLPVKAICGWGQAEHSLPWGIREDLPEKVTCRPVAVSLGSHKRPFSQQNLKRFN